MKYAIRDFLLVATVLFGLFSGINWTYQRGYHLGFTAGAANEAQKYYTQLIELRDMLNKH